MKNKIIILLLIFQTLVLTACQNSNPYSQNEVQSNYIPKSYDYRAEIIDGHNICLDYYEDDGIIKILDENTYEILWTIDYKEYGKLLSRGAVKFFDYNYDNYFDISITTTSGKTIYWYWDENTKSFYQKPASSSSNQTKLVFSGDTENLSKDMKSDIEKTFYINFDLIWERFSSNEKPESIDLKFDKSYDYSKNLYSLNENTITINPELFIVKEYEYDIILEAVFEICVNYKETAPSWIYSGLICYVRNKYAMFNYEANWYLPSEYRSGSLYDGEKTAAAFFVWIEENYQRKIINYLHNKLDSNQYTDLFWFDYTQKNLDELWLEYSGNELQTP